MSSTAKAAPAASASRAVSVVARVFIGILLARADERGRWLERSDGRKVLITLHPSALLRVEPGDKAAAYAAWVADLRKAAAHFAAL